MNDCRTCLKQVITDKNCVNIKAQVIDGMDVLQVIEEVASLKGSHDDLLPKFICKNCVKLLKSTTMFRRMVVDSYSQLMDKLKARVSSSASTESTERDDNQNRVKIEDVLLSNFQDVEIQAENILENEVTQISNAVASFMKNQLCVEQSVLDFQPAVDQTIAGGDFVGTDKDYQSECREEMSISREQCNEETDILENRGLPSMPKLVHKKRRKEKTLNTLRVKLGVKSKRIKMVTEPVATNTRSTTEKNNEENAIKELSDEVQLSLQKIKQNNKSSYNLTGQCNDADIILKSKANSLPAQNCTMCGITVKGKKKYDAHMKAHNPELSPLQYVCSICPKKYPKKEYLLVHTRSHTGEKPYHCDICDKNFSQFATYYVHKRRLHDKVVQGTCSYCGKVFVDKPELDVHIKMWHTGERPYLCEFCSATFVCNRTLQRHRKEIHSEKKPCQKCGKMMGDYALKKHLVRHQVLEEGLKIVRKKYTCEYCKTVMNFTSRRRHLEKQHGIKLHGRGDDCTKISMKETTEKEALSTEIF